jgi:L-fuculose-phosphate aldolase
MSGLPAGVTEERLRRELLETAHALHARGWVANHDGNASCRLGPGRLLCTPTAVSKGDVTAESLIVVDDDNAVVQGTRRAFSELQLHRAAYAARPDIGVVLHAHPPHATAFAVSGRELGHPFMAEPVVSLGPKVPVVAYHRPKDPALDAAIGAALAEADVAILDRHGVLAVGGSFEQALLRLELLEHLAGIAAAAASLGGVRALPAAEVAALSAKGRPGSQPSWGDPVPVARAVDQSGGGRAPSRPSAARPDVAGLVDATLRRFQ